MGSNSFINTSLGPISHCSSTYTYSSATWVRSTKMLKLVVAVVMLHVVASKPLGSSEEPPKPLDVNVEVTVNGVKIPINIDKEENSKTGGIGYGHGLMGGAKEGEEVKQGGRFDPNSSYWSGGFNWG